MSAQVPQVSPQDPVANRVSRYRSVRRKVSADASATAPPRVEASHPSESPLERSRSRYRKAGQAANTKSSLPGLPDGVPKPVLDGRAPAAARQHPVRTSSHQKPSHTPQASPISPVKRPDAAGLVPTRANPSSARDRGREEARQILEGEAGRQRDMQERIKIEKLEEQKRQAEQEELRRTQAEMEAQARAHRERELQQKAEREAVARREKDEREQAEIARRMREKQRELQARAARKLGPTENADTKKHANQPLLMNGVGSKAQQPHEDQTQSSSQGVFAFMKRRRGDTVVRPGFRKNAASADAAALQQPFHAAGVDAPISAVNAGERHVLVECQSKSVWLPVTPTTTPRDLVRSAATFLTVPINPKASVLMESFGKVGVQRPLRSYEHVRDVLNSWDDDKQNSLVLLPSATGGDDPDLEASSVLKEEPLEFGCPMQYSQKPGKWDKRWVTLRPDGQVTLSKKQGVKPSDQTNVCHISDFDIYTPSQKEMSRKIRPPRRLCFAIKSQQKSNLFESLESFVHFFCTNDKKLAAAFYRAVQGWRSWYLVNVLGAGQKTRDKAAAATKANEPDDTASPGHRRDASKDSHYQLGSFKPLIDMDVFAAPADPDKPAPPHARQKPARTSGGAVPPSSFPRKHSALSPTEEEPFAPTGLLGRTYSQRQRALDARDSDGPSAAPAPAQRPSADLARRPAPPAGPLIALAKTMPIAAGDDAPRAPAGRVMSGAEAERRGRPLLDARDESAFVEGSLLRRVEMREGPRAPVLDRSRGREVEVGTGEGI